MNQCIFQIKKEKFRESVRKNKNEEQFQLNRSLQSNIQKRKFRTISSSLSQQVELSTRIILQNDETILKLMEQYKQQHSLIILCNMCSSESKENIRKIIEEFKIHSILIQILQQRDSTSWQREYAFEGLANLLSSKVVLIPLLQELLDIDIITIMIKIQQQIDEDVDINKKTLLKFCRGILCQIKIKNIQRYLSKSQLVDLFTINIKWFEVSPDVCCQNIITICEDVEGLFDLIEESKLSQFLHLALETYQTERNICKWILIMINKLLSSCNASISVKLISKQEIMRLINQILVDYISVQQIVLENALLFVNFMLSFHVLELEQDNLNLITQVLEITDHVQANSILLQCSQFLARYTDSFDENYSRLEKIIENQFKIVSKFVCENEFEGAIKVLENIWTMLIYSEYQLKKEQQDILEQLVLQRHQELSEIASAILQNQFDIL